MANARGNTAATRERARGPCAPVRNGAVDGARIRAASARLLEVWAHVTTVSVVLHDEPRASLRAGAARLRALSPCAEGRHTAMHWARAVGAGLAFRRGRALLPAMLGRTHDGSAAGLRATAAGFAALREVHGYPCTDEAVQGAFESVAGARVNTWRARLPAKRRGCATARAALHTATTTVAACIKAAPLRRNAIDGARSGCRPFSPGSAGSPSRGLSWWAMAHTFRRWLWRGACWPTARLRCCAVMVWPDEI